MGIKTSANSIFFVRRVEPTDSPNEVLIETEGGERLRIEKDLIRPLIRGRDVDAWSYETRGWIIWTHDDRGRVLDEEEMAKYPKAKKYFEKHAEKLRKRDDYKDGQPIWVIFRVSEEKLKDKVAWQDIAKILECVYIPPEPVIDHTAYLVSVPNKKDGYILSGILNSTVLRTFMATYVNRTGAEYCHYLAWIVGLAPIPFSKLKESKNIAEISKRLHEVRGDDKELLERLDKAVAELYGISDWELKQMKEFLDFFVR